MTIREAIHYVMELQNERGKQFVSFQDIVKAIEEEMKEGEEKGIYYQAYINLGKLRASLS